MMKHMVLVAVVLLGGLSEAQSTRPADDAHCSQLRFRSASALPSYNGPGFGTVEYPSPDEPFIVPAGCFQFFCSRKQETYRVLSCPNLKVKNSGRNATPASSLGVDTVPSASRSTR